MVARKGITSKYYCIEMFSFVGYNIYHGNSVSPASASVYCSSIKKNYIISLKNKKERRIRNTNEHTNTYMHAQTKISAVLPENAVEAHDSVDSHMTWKIAAYWNAHTHTNKQCTTAFKRSHCSDYHEFDPIEVRDEADEEQLLPANRFFSHSFISSFHYMGLLNGQEWVWLTFYMVRSHWIGSLVTDRIDAFHIFGRSSDPTPYTWTYRHITS